MLHGLPACQSEHALSRPHLVGCMGTWWLPQARPFYILPPNLHHGLFRQAFSWSPSLRLTQVSKYQNQGELNPWCFWGGPGPLGIVDHRGHGVSISAVLTDYARGGLSLRNAQ